MSEEEFWRHLADVANERAERYSEAAEDVERFARAAEESSKVEDESVGRSTWTDDDGVEHATEVTLTTEDEELWRYSGDVEEFTIQSGETVRAEPAFGTRHVRGNNYERELEEFCVVTKDDYERARAEQAGKPLEYEGEFSFTIGDESNVECPEWLVCDEEHPNGYVACPRCDFYPLDECLSGVPGEPIEFTLGCRWPFCPNGDGRLTYHYTGEEAREMWELYNRADKIR